MGRSRKLIQEEAARLKSIVDDEPYAKSLEKVRKACKAPRDEMTTIVEGGSKGVLIYEEPNLF